MIRKIAVYRENICISPLHFGIVYIRGSFINVVHKQTDTATVAEGPEAQKHEHGDSSAEHLFRMLHFYVQLCLFGWYSSSQLMTHLLCVSESSHITVMSQLGACVKVPVAHKHCKSGLGLKPDFDVSKKLPIFHMYALDQRQILLLLFG